MWVPPSPRADAAWCLALRVVCNVARPAVSTFLGPRANSLGVPFCEAVAERIQAGFQKLGRGLVASDQVDNLTQSVRSVGQHIRVIVVSPPERREVPAEVQFEVARNTVTDTADLGTARLRTGLGQG
jgi:hypothetical protein